MRRLLLASILVLSAGCGGSSTNPNTPPPPPPPSAGPAASLTSQAGDAQQAEPGAPVTIKPAVLVKDAAGRVVSGATVQFTVIGGGGTVTGASATSNAQGIAAVGSWILGPIDEQTLEASLGSVTPVRFHATVAPPLTEKAIGPSGGTLEITATGHPYKGLLLTVPPAAFSGSGTWRIGLSGTTPTQPLPAGFTDAGPALAIETDRGRATELMTLRIPVQTAPGEVPIVVLIDPSRNVMEMIPLVGYDNASATVAATHLNPSFLLGPTVAASVQASAQRGLLTGVIRVLKANKNAILKAVAGAIGPLRNGWPLVDIGSLGFPLGHGVAPSLLGLLGSALPGPLSSLVKAAWPGGPPADSAAFGALEVIAKRDAGKAGGIASLINDLAGKLLGPGSSAKVDTVTAINLRAGLAVSQIPQLLALIENPPAGGEPRVVFAPMAGAENSTMWFTQPHQPAAPTPVELGPNGFSLSPVHEVLDATLFPPEHLVALGGSMVLPIEEYRDVMDKMMNALTGADAVRKQAIKQLFDEADIPKVKVELQPTEGAAWKEVDSTIVVRDSTAQVRVVCETCPGATPSHGGWLSLVGKSLEPIAATLALKMMGPDLHSLMDPISGFGKISGSVNSLLSALVRGLPGPLQRLVAPVNLSFAFPILKIDPATQRGAVGAPVTFHAKVADPPKAGYDMEWTWGDGKVEVVADVDSASHEYEAEGDFEVKATLKYRTPAGAAPWAVAKAKVKIGPPQFIWKFQTLTITSSVLPPGGIGPERIDTLIYNAVTKIATDLEAHPDHGAFFVYQIPVAGPSCQSIAGLEHFPAGQVADSVTSVFAVLGICGDEDITGTITMGKLGNGTIVGTATGTANDETITLPGGTVNATMKGKELTGSFVWLVRYTNGQGSYSADFKAQQIRP